LDLIWLNTNEGPSRLTAYARRGTTDILRDIHGITVSDLEQHDGPGYVSFKATGKNKAGRQEIAIGAYTIEGLKGDRLAAAVATAQTRALRRLTLQFVGLAILDESEVSAFTNQSQNAPSQLAIVPPPSVAVSNAPGKDITPEHKVEQAAVNAKLDEVTAAISGTSSNTQGQLLRQDPTHDMTKCVESNVPCGNMFHDITKFTVVGDGIRHNTQEEFEAFQAKLRADAIASLNESARRQEMGIEPTHANPVIEVAPKKTRKPRSPNKPKVDLGPSEPVPVKSIVPEPKDVERIQTTMIPVSQDPKTQAQVSAIASLVELEKATRRNEDGQLNPNSPVNIITKPRLTPDQVKPFRQRLFRVVNDYLEPHGFAPKEGMGNADKMRAFANMMFSDVTNMNELTVEQWEKYLTVLENKIKTEGPAATVKYVEESIGI